MSFTARVARNLMAIKASKALKEEIEKAGVDTLTTLADKGISIVGTYLEGLSPQDKEKYRRHIRDIQNMGVTMEAVLNELYGQIPELGDIMKKNTDYVKAELQKVQEFLEGKI
jgi:hypothetical protein